jgi:hypothetical protein
MGNQTSQPSSDFQKQFYQLQQQVKNQQQRQTVDLSRLQNQLHYTQMKLQEMKQNQQRQKQYPHQYPPQQQQYQQQQYPQQQYPQQQYPQQQYPQQQYQQKQYSQQQYPPQQHQQQHQQQQYQQQQYQQQQYNNSQGAILQNNNKMVSLLNSPDLKQEMANNPAFGVQIIELILKEFGTQLSDNQYEKINDYLEKATYQTNNQQHQQQQQQQQLQQLQYQQKQYNNQNQNQNQNHNQNQIQAHRTANMPLAQKYQTEEEQERQNFEREQERRKQEFEEKQKKRRNDYQNQLKMFESSQTNAYKLLGVPANYTLEQLKVAYRKKAIQTHPDKGGNPELFDEVTKAYFSLLEKLKNKEQDKQFMDLKSQSKSYIEDQSGKNKQNINMSKEKFNLTAFNKIFEENKISEPTDVGYDEWLKDEKAVKEPPKVFSTKFNLDVFNSQFENWKDEDENLHREIVLRDEPTALVAFHGKTGYSELGVDRVDDFSHSDPNSRGIGYTDLKQAYSRNGLINTKAIQPRESYKNVEDYERARAKISYTMTPEDIRREEMKKRREQEEEDKRIQRVQNNDNNAFNKYNRIHQLMLDKLK